MLAHMWPEARGPSGLRGGVGAALVRTGKFDPAKAFVADALAFSTVPSNIPPQAIEGMTGPPSVRP